MQISCKNHAITNTSFLPRVFLIKLIVSSGKFIGNSRKLYIDKHIMSLLHKVDRDIKREGEEMRE